MAWGLFGNPPSLSWGHDLDDDFKGLRASRTAVDEQIYAWFDEFPTARCGTVFHYRDSAGTRRQAMVDQAFEFL